MSATVLAAFVSVTQIVDPSSRTQARFANKVAFASDCRSSTNASTARATAPTL